jgi:DeoR/GlpR family transcriptional regulator of sugar metabolism
MLQVERLEKIYEIVKQEKYCSISELAEKFNISKATIRRDLKILEDDNKVKNTRGGAMAENHGTSHEPPYTEKTNINKEEKILLAKGACRLIAEGETIILDSGTTIMEIANTMKQMNDITVATNDVMVACILAENPNISTTMIGGGIRKNYFSTSGLFAQETILNINADKAFIGVDAFDPAKGFMITNMEEVVIKRLMMEAAKQVIVICDHSKCENVAFIKLCGINDVDKMITGREIGTDMYQSLVDAGLDVELV